MDSNFRRRVFRVKHTRMAQHVDELSVHEGDTLTTVNKKLPDSFSPSDWIFCKTERGIQGIVIKAIIEEFQDIDGRKYILGLECIFLREYLTNNRTALKSVAMNICELVGREGKLLSHFVTQVAKTLNSESNNTYYSKENVNICRHLAEKINTLSSFVNTLKCEEGCPFVIIEFFVQVLEEWLSQISSCTDNGKVCEYIKEFKVHNVIPRTLSSFFEEAASTDWSEIVGDKKAQLEQFASFINVVRISSQIAQEIRMKFKECTESHFISPTARIIKYRNLFFFCRALKKICPNFAAEISADQEYLKAKAEHTTQVNANMGIFTALSSIEKMSISYQAETISMTEQDSLSNLDCEMAECEGESDDPGKNLSEDAIRVLQDKWHKIKEYTRDIDFTTIVELGRGGQAITHLVKITATSELMVFKEFGGNRKLKEKQSPMVIAMETYSILNELGKLFECEEHPNILKASGIVYDDAERRIPVGIIVDWMQQGSLDDAIYKKKRNMQEFGEKEVLLWSLQIASALDCLHKKKLIHRDVKPENILLKNMEHCMLSDFGMAKRDKLESPPKSNCGTTGYRAPETYLNKPYSTPADVYSLGITIWEMAERRNPTISANCIHTEGTSGPRPDIRNPKYQWLQGLLPHMWHDDPDKRPTMKQVLAHLTELYKI